MRKRMCCLAAPIILATAMLVTPHATLAQFSPQGVVGGGEGRFLSASRSEAIINEDYETSSDSIDAGFNPGANDDIYAIAVQADGKILVGGDFTALGGGTGTTTRNHLGRINVDGSLDTTFNPGANDTVRALAIQADGKILVGGYFSGLGGGTGTTARNHIGRLNADGSVDTSFNPGADGSVFALVLQADKKILVGGDFSTLGGTTRYKIGRLLVNGTPDSFNPGATDKVLTMAIQADGKVWAGGDFLYLGGGDWPYSGTRCDRIGRLKADGSIDTSVQGGGANNRVSALAVQANGKILVGGDFTWLGGETRDFICRLNEDTSLDSSFNPFAIGYDVRAIRIQTDGNFLVGGFFSELGDETGGMERHYIGRYNSNGLLDEDFAPGANLPVNAFAIQADGKILCVGAFTTLGGGGSGTTTRNHIGRLMGGGSSNCTLACTASASPSSGQAPLVVNFTATATPSNCTGSPSYYWTFGDGQTSTLQNPSHTYTSTGTKNWTLSVTQAGVSCSQSGTIIVNAVAPPSVSSMAKLGNPFRIKVLGSNFQSGIQVFIGGSASAWPNVVLKNAGLLVIKGGSSLKSGVPKNTPTEFRLVNPDGGEMTTIWQWP